MYCNSCSGIIKRDELVYCEQCHVPLHKECANHCLECGKVLCDTCYANNTFKCEECYKPENMFQVIRRSHLEQYAGCPYSLYLQLVLGIEPPMGSYAQAGVITHEIINSLTEHDISLIEAKENLNMRIEEWNKENNNDYSFITKEIRQANMDCLDNFWLIKDSLPKNFVSEHNIIFSIDDNLPKISCTLDRIETVGNEIHIRDWKTGKPMAGQKLVTDLQPPLYLYAVYSETGILPTSFTLHYLRNNNNKIYKKVGDWTYEVTTTRKTYKLDIQESLKETKKILKGIVNNEFNIPNEKTNKWRCENMCWFKKAGKCDSSFNEEWKILSERN